MFFTFAIAATPFPPPKVVCPFISAKNHNYPVYFPLH